MKSQYLIALFFLGLVLLNYPILDIYNVQGEILGIPVLFFMVFFFWALLIALTYWVVKKTKDNKDA